MTVGGRGLSEEDLTLVEWVAKHKIKELTRERDLRRWAGLIPRNSFQNGDFYSCLFSIGLLKSGRKNLVIG